LPKLSTRLGAVSVSPSTAMTVKARELAQRGVKVVSLSTGEPDFATPDHIIDAAFRAARAGDTHYPPHDGTRALKEAVQRKFRRENNLDYALNEIMVGNGAKQLIFNALMATLDAGDEVILPTPCYASYADMTRSVGGTPVMVPCAQNNGFRPRPEDIEAAITPRTRWVLLNFPNNPTGVICSRADLQALAAVLLRHPDIWVMTDDIYEHLLYDGHKFHTVAEVEPGLFDRTLTINGLSKAYCMTGWRLGYAGGPVALIDAMRKLQSQSTSNPSSITQAAAVEALDGPQDFIAANNAKFVERRDLVVSMLNQANGLKCPKPEGAFYVYPSCAGAIGKTSASGKKIANDEDFATALLEEEGVAVVHGAAFASSPAFRISYATSKDVLEEACRRIQRFCGNLR
jgi:aspartate aminotransferase